jgi:hypothetical protein
VPSRGRRGIVASPEIKQEEGNIMWNKIKAVIVRGMSMACSKGDHMGCPGMSCNCSCHN